MSQARNNNIRGRNPQQLTEAELQKVAERARRRERRRIARQQLRSEQGGGPGRTVSIAGQELDLPHDEQALIQSIIDREPGEMTHGYLKTLLLPKYAMSRVPDSFADSTALVRSIAIIDVPVFNTSAASGDAGRFSAAIQPILGGLSRPSHYKVALVDASTAWPNDFTRPSSFLSMSNGKDIRLDPNMTTLTQPEMGCQFWAGDDTTAGQGVPFGTNPTVLSGYGLSVDYEVVNTALWPSGISTFYFPPGIYTISVAIRDTGAGNIARPMLLPVGGATLDPETGLVSPDGDVGTWTGYLVVPRSTAGGAGFTVTENTVATTPSFPQASLMATRTFDDVDGVPNDYGLVQKLRPVAMSVLATYTGPPLLAGGKISTAFVPGGALESQYFSTTNNPLGNLAAWQNLSAIKGSFNGEIVKGTYAWWSPTSVTDYAMYTPDQSLDYEYPGIVVSGQFAPGQAFVDGTTVCRLEVVTVYEIQTDSMLLESRYQSGSQALMDTVLGHLVGEPHCLINDDHISFGKKILNAFKSAGQWLYKNRKPIGSVIGTLGGLLL